MTWRFDHTDRVGSTDGLPTGPCPQGTAPNPCDSYFSGSGSVTFTFNGVALGGLPTNVGLVWTDGGFGTTVTFTVTGPNGLLGTIVGSGFADSSNFGGTAEDRFFGWTDPGGIVSITMSNPGGGIEVDHLQYGRLGETQSVPEPGTLLLLAAGVVGVALRRRS